MPNIHHALILTAGLGTRLRPLTLVRAKPAIPVAGEPIVRRIARWLAASHVTDLVLNLHHLPASLTAVMGDGSDLGVRVRYSWEQPRVLGSAGGPRLALPLIDAETFFIVNGDTLTDVNLSRLADAHASSSALVTLALTANHEPTRYGSVQLDRQGRYTGVVRPGPRADGGFHFVGVQAVSAEAVRSVTAGEAADSIGDVYDRLIADRPGSVVGFVSDPAFHDIGTVEDYIATSRLFAAEASTIADNPSRQLTPASVHIDSSAHVTQSIFWNNIEVGRDCIIDGCIVTDGVSVPAGSVHRASILIRTADGVTALPLENLLHG